MESKTSGIRVFVCILFALIFFFSALGYFVYGGMNGVFAVFILCVLYCLAVFLSCVPLVGIVLQGVVSLLWIFPLIKSFTGIEQTWLTSLIIVLFMLYGLIRCFEATFSLFGAIRDWLMKRSRDYKAEAVKALLDVRNQKEPLVRSMLMNRLIDILEEGRLSPDDLTKATPEEKEELKKILARC